MSLCSQHYITRCVRAYFLKSVQFCWKTKINWNEIKYNVLVSALIYLWTKWSESHTFQIMYREPKATDWRCETRNKLHAYVRCVEPNVWVCRSLTQIPLNAVQCLLYRIFHKTSRFHINHHQHSRINAALCEFIFPFIMCIIIFIFVNITSHRLSGGCTIARRAQKLQLISNTHLYGFFLTDVVFVFNFDCTFGTLMWMQLNAATILQWFLIYTMQNKCSYLRRVNCMLTTYNLFIWV